jgi:prophage antirepressor-like protein
MEHPMDNALVRLRATFEAHPLSIVEFKGRTFYVGLQIGEALDCTDGGRGLVTKITGDWRDEIIPGVDSTIFTGQELAAIKAALGPNVIDPRTPSLLMLTQTGVFAAVLLSRQPKARAFRRWLTTEVLPQLAETGSYQLAPAAAPALSAEPHHHLQLLLDLHTCGEIAPTAFARRIGAMLKADDLDVAARNDLVDELVRLAGGTTPASPAPSAPTPARSVEAPAEVPTGGAVGTFEAWLTTCCVVRSDLTQASATLFASYLAFAETCGDVPLGKTSWQHCMKQQRFVPTRIGRASSRAWQGVALAAPAIPEAEEPEAAPAEAPPSAWHGKVLAWMQGRKTATILQIATQGLGLKPGEISKAIQMQIADVLREAGFYRQKQGTIVSWSRQPARVLS